MENLKKNSIDTAQEVGYYRVEGNKILFERLVSSDFGQYVLLEGKIKGDTIFFTQSRWPGSDKIIKYVKSNLSTN